MSQAGRDPTLKRWRERERERERERKAAIIFSVIETIRSIKGTFLLHLFFVF